MYNLIINIIIAVISTVFHEWGHAYMAWSLGDWTVAQYLTFDPRATIHINLIIGELLNYLGINIQYLLRYGYIIYHPENIQRKYRKYGKLYIALAGPFMNFILAFAFYNIKMQNSRLFSMYIVDTFIEFNTMSLFVNLLPLPGLDGFELVNCFFPEFKHLIKLNDKIVALCVNVAVELYSIHAFTFIKTVYNITRLLSTPC